MVFSCCFSGRSGGTRVEAYETEVVSYDLAQQLRYEGASPPDSQRGNKEIPRKSPYLKPAAAVPILRRVQDSPFAKVSFSTTPTAVQAEVTSSSELMDGVRTTSTLSTQSRSLGPTSLQMTTPELLLRDIELHEFVGAGAFASVFKGSWQCADAAIKILATQTLDMASLKEAIVSPQLSHPNVVQTFTSRCAHMEQSSLDKMLLTASSNASEPTGNSTTDQDFKSGEGFGAPNDRAHGHGNQLLWIMNQMSAVPNQYLTMMVMEHCDRGTLHTAIHKGVFHPSSSWGVHTAKRALLRTVQDICRGMMHLHEAGVMHGDLKPANVLLKAARRDKRGFTAKIADFGLCKLLDGLESASSVAWGTVAYMSPERFQRQMTCASDVFSFGVLLSEMMNRERPYEDCKPGEVVVGVMSGELRPTFPDAHPDLAEIGLRCIAVNPLERPTFRELEEAFVAIERDMRRELQDQKSYSPLSSYSSLEPPTHSKSITMQHDGVSEQRASRLGPGL